ncbi:hypothetical protein [Bacillus mycoides]|uniref:hypothetical protein n=1 Tax=Bacillus mycoides TaxID=1405 RepID=UPI000BF49873|nr:hypothetical protein [Bacillus mycoides]PGA05606.1 hypothetical protein COL71_25685 [Bacillus mycoides]
MSNKDVDNKDEPYIYKLPLDRKIDKDLLDWLDTMTRNKKAEIVRHALRFYKSHLREGEFFYYAPPAPNSHPVYADSMREVASSVQEPVEDKKPKRPKAGIFSISKTEE